MALVIGCGVTSFTGSLRLEAFGLRQIAGAVLAVVLGGGILLQAVAAMVGAWAIGGPDRIPPAWAVVEGGAAGPYRVLWLTGPGGDDLPAPAGDPQRRVDAGAASVRLALTDREGASILDLGRPRAGPGPDRLEDALEEILGGTTHHGGALLSSFGVRFVVAEDVAISDATRRALDAQLDLDLVPAVGLTVYRNAAAMPPAAVLDVGVEPVLSTDDPALIATWRPVDATRLTRVRGGWNGPAASGTVFLSTEHDPDWALRGTGQAPRALFGWATGFTAEGEPVRVRHEGRLPAAIQSILLTVLWVAALWVTRKPVPR
jgi:hypothetical protein